MADRPAMPRATLEHIVLNDAASANAPQTSAFIVNVLLNQLRCSDERRRKAASARGRLKTMKHT